MTHIFAILLILALHLPGQASALTCTVGYTNAGKAICRCYDKGRWAPWPMLACKLLTRR